MKKVIVILIAGLISIGAFAEATPKVGQVDTVYEGILQLHVKLGQKVKKGQLLFTMDTNLLKVAVIKANNNLNYTKEIYERNKKLYDSSHSVSREKLEEYKYNYINALADFKTAKINVKNCYYYAPFAGTVTKIIYGNGSAVGDGNEVMDITASISTDQNL
ncbi:MAG TPA: biotin/lipoyl-binding protein [Victivallales bacterium]|nr:biotin/lipoyl-binding protein [Victivallales bacterium]